MTETLSSDIPDTLQDAIERLLRTACDADLSLATAESCTGGLLASLLTDVQGCSHAFERGFVVYTEKAKQEMLGVAADLLEKHGAVSEPVARAMAEGRSGTPTPMSPCRSPVSPGRRRRGRRASCISPAPARDG
ncbi:C-terminal domain protein of CinA type S [Rubellimicrobium mesophilum DSM 19309]|uniref:C-terminal domain protein of CinA type S n=1 Tax=Rubellimicrobium mesophilum DSM 19309 TaxID=442562 RepID=A0A017HKU4_9RHOB|nr:C-terminal domain protein of CinA type S [Rubellimicrobium mesophilum DSM 19309]